MTKKDKIKICREFMGGKEIWEIASDMTDRGINYTLVNKSEVEKALRWGLKHPDELRKGKA